ncbi:MAG: hypothetical protein ORN51_09380 [Akkermansiaceae bacterium]|nr:hypothetical protein [Akkermansiaceae bacterium]
MNQMNPMLQTIFLVTLAVTSHAASPTSDVVKLPPDAERLKQTHQESVAKATQPLREQVIIAGNPQDALAIKTELNSSTQRTLGEVVAASEFKRRLFKTKWAWNNDLKFTFERDGSTPGRGFKWKIVKPYIIEYNYPDGNHGTIVFERGMKRAVINETRSKGDKITLPLIRVRD